MFQLVKKNSTVTLRPLAPLIKSFSSTPSAHARPDSNMDLFLKDLNSRAYPVSFWISSNANPKYQYCL